MRPTFKYIAFAMRPAVSMGSQAILVAQFKDAKPRRKQVIQLAAVSILVLGLIVPVVWAQNAVQTIAGGGPNNLPALKSSLGSPAAVYIDGAGNVYVADLYSERVLRVDTAGNVTVVAGSGAHSGFPRMVAPPSTPTLHIPAAWPWIAPATFS